MTVGSVVVVGLGPAGAGLVLPVARDALLAARVRFTRTARHPAVAELAAEGLELEALDRHYEHAPSLDDAYRAIVDELVEASKGPGNVAYAVPGNPAMAERTVALLREADVAVEVVPGLSFAELAWARLGVDPVHARVADGRDLDRAAVLRGGPLLVAQCDTRAVLSDVKLALLEELEPDTEVTVLRRLGLADETIGAVALEDLDRSVEPDHLTSVFADLGPGSAQELARFQALIERLRAPGGCPWDAEQTHRSLSRHVLEEAYEVVDAIEGLPPAAPGGDTEVPQLLLEERYALLEEELGDLAAQVVFHATLAREAGAFTMTGVLSGIREKLVRRHPHVFGDVEVDGAEGVMRNWEQIKQAEKAEKAGETQETEQRATTSLVDGIPEGLPSLLLAHKLFRKAAAGGLEPMDVDEASAAIVEAARRLPEAGPEEVERLVGDLLASVALVARHRGFDAESALRGWTRRFRDRFRAMEALAAGRDVELAAAAPGEVAALWIEAAAAPRP